MIQLIEVNNMPKTYVITAEMAIDIRQQMKATKCVVACRRMEAVALRVKVKTTKIYPQ